MQGSGIRVATVDWDEAAARIRAVRETVFVGEQGIPEHLEWDGLDPQCLHVLALSEGGEPIGTGRINSEGKIGRMAVLREWRGRGVGRALLRELVELGRRRGLCRVTLDAQVQVTGFYERHGFRPVGKIFPDAGIPHRRMVMDIPRLTSSKGAG